MSTSTTGRRTRQSIDERTAQAEALHNSITEQVEQLRSSDRWRAFLNFAKSFHDYSLNNLLLILSQRPNASRVAGYRTWQTLNRQVRKGERGIHIFGYSTKNITEEDENGDEVQKRVTRFPVLTVFDISQTDLIDGADGPTALAQQLTGTDDFGVIDTLTAHLVKEGWTIERHPLPGTQNGTIDPETFAVVLDSDLSPEHSAKTLIHEAAHILLGHTDDLAEYAQHRGLVEVEAESVTYIVAGLTGFNTSAYSIGYIAGWANADTQLIKSTASRVLSTANDLATLLDKTGS